MSRREYDSDDGRTSSRQALPPPVPPPPPPPPPPPLVMAARYNLVYTLATLLAAGEAFVDVNATDTEGQTALHTVASLHNDTRGAQNARALLRHGAKHAQRNNADRTPLDCASVQNNMAVYTVLCPHGDVTVGGGDGDDGGGGGTCVSQ